MAHMGGTRRKKQKANADAANGWMLVVEGGPRGRDGLRRGSSQRQQVESTTDGNNKPEKESPGQGRTGLMSSDSGSRDRASSNCS